MPDRKSPRNVVVPTMVGEARVLDHRNPNGFHGCDVQNKGGAVSTGDFPAVDFNALKKRACSTPRASMDFIGITK